MLSTQITFDDLLRVNANAAQLAGYYTDLPADDHTGSAFWSHKLRDEIINTLQFGVSDFFGRPFEIGDIVIKSVGSGSSSGIKFAVVNRIDNGKVYADSKSPMQYPNKLVILNRMDGSVPPYPIVMK